MSDLQVTTEQVKKSIKNAQSAEEAMQIAGLDWSVEQAPLMTANGLDVPSHKALYRSDTNKILSVVGSGFETLQNHEAFAFVDTFRERFGGSYENSFCLSGGARIMIQLKINGGFDIRTKHGDDHVDNYLNFFEARGGGSVLAFSGNIRAFCSNQFRSMRRSKNESFAIRHTKNMKNRVEEAFQIFAMGQEWFTKFQEKAQHLAQKMVDRKMVDSFLDEVVGLPVTEEWSEEHSKNIVVEHPRTAAQRERVTELFESGKGNYGESAWELFNSVTESVDHYKHVNNADKRFTSALLGHGADVKQKAFDTALAL